MFLSSPLSVSPRSILTRHSASASAARINSVFRHSARLPSQLPRTVNWRPAYRTMASGAPKKPDWIVIVPDAASTTLEKRMGFRDAHISNLGPIIESGFLKMGGAVLSHHPKNGEAPPMKGSALIVQADSEEEIRDILAKDVYATSGVWDLDNVKVYPFRCAFNAYER
ncbi:hypothetical protein D8B26_003542 [Coccidioides posadasii str. Silveira]|uniref:uncharacterized protein n=1 Tax=Coccidioides posadasii (strain RMSCC 757 / Silveira) TaxID=443226 RepID=UPI001BEEDA4C|nr:hypothetical protein D8B26_003542 [Coccidioides posadasii str. Silveira]